MTVLTQRQLYEIAATAQRLVDTVYKDVTLRRDLEAHHGSNWEALLRALASVRAAQTPVNGRA